MQLPQNVGCSQKLHFSPHKSKEVEYPLHLMSTFLIRQGFSLWPWKYLKTCKRRKTSSPKARGRGRSCTTYIYICTHTQVTDKTLTWKSLLSGLNMLPLPEKCIMHKAILPASFSKPPEQSPFIGHGALQAAPLYNQVAQHIASLFCHCS